MFDLTPYPVLPAWRAPWLRASTHCREQSYIALTDMSSSSPEQPDQSYSVWSSIGSGSDPAARVKAAATCADASSVSAPDNGAQAPDPAMAASGSGPGGATPPSPKAAFLGSLGPEERSADTEDQDDDGGGSVSSENTVYGERPAETRRRTKEEEKAREEQGKARQEHDASDAAVIAVHTSRCSTDESAPKRARLVDGPPDLPAAAKAASSGEASCSHPCPATAVPRTMAADVASRASGSSSAPATAPAPRPRASKRHRDASPGTTDETTLTMPAGRLPARLCSNAETAGGAPGGEAGGTVGAGGTEEPSDRRGPGGEAEADCRVGGPAWEDGGKGDASSGDEDDDDDRSGDLEQWSEWSDDEDDDDEWSGDWEQWGESSDDEDEFTDADDEEWRPSSGGRGKHAARRRSRHRAAVPPPSPGPGGVASHRSPVAALGGLGAPAPPAPLYHPQPAQDDDDTGPPSPTSAPAPTEPAEEAGKPAAGPVVRRPAQRRAAQLTMVAGSSSSDTAASKLRQSPPAAAAIPWQGALGTGVETAMEPDADVIEAARILVASCTGTLNAH